MDGLLATARTLAVDATTHEFVVALRARGVRGIVLKGPALAAWLYDDGAARPYGDGDVLVAPGDVEAARTTLADLGYALVLNAPPVFGAPHAEPYTRPGGGEIDLHWMLSGVTASPATAWRALSARTEHLDVGGARFEVLALGGRALVVALHAAQHGTGRPLRDLARALERAEPQHWREARDLAHAVGATAAFARGLRLLPEGAATADVLRLPGEPVLAAMAQAPLVLGVDRFAQAGSWRERAALVRAELAPSPARRAIWLARHALPSVRAWRRARRA